MELARFPSRGGFSVRSIFTFVLAVVMTALLWAILASSPTHAADATWNGAAITYEDNQYTSMGEVKDTDTISLPTGTTYFMRVEVPTGQSPNQGLQKAHVIYFTPGVDPPTATTATYVVYDYNPNTKVFSNASGTTEITVDPSGANQSGTSCAIEQIGWIVCPTMNFLAWGMDIVFSLLAGFMEVQPLETGNTDGSLYNAWNIMRGIANIAFIIAFLIIIYSQLTSVQVSAYGIKKLLPRLIIAAIAVNVSYIICAIVVDLSNILGYSLQDVFVQLHDQIMATPSTPSSSLGNWQSVTGFVLSGGTAVAALGVGTAAAIIATGGVVTAAVFILLPALVGLLLAILLVLLILAARQALIVILVIVAPIAIVAYLLPNTEKWFGKWRDLFLTMLIFFPAFSVVFGGSQLAGAVIIQNAQSINMLILGMIVQVAPLIITPLLLKFSGGVLGTVARAVNNPNKGLIDRTRNWSKSHSDWHRDRGRGGLDRNGNPLTDKNGNPVGLRKRNALRQSARYLDQRKRRRSDRTANAETATQNAYEVSNRYAKKDNKGNLKYDMAQQKALYEHQKDEIHSKHAAHVDKARRTQGSMLYQPGLDARTAKNIAERSEAETGRFYNVAQNNERFANRVGAGALHTSALNLEAAKDKLQTSENRKTEFYTTQRATVGQPLNRAAVQLETSKLTLEGAQSNYTATITDLQTNARSGIAIAAQNAQASKDHVEGAQNRLKEFFDKERANAGSTLNVSNLNLERSKSNATIAEDTLTTYVSRERSQAGGSLRTITMDAERIKQKKETSENELAAMLEGMKSGKLDPASLTTQQRIIMEEASDDAVRLAATKRSVVSAQFETQSRFADVMTSTGPLTEQMLDIAQGVGGIDARSRAQADAVKTKRSLESSELTNSIELLKEAAKRNDTNPKQYSAGVVQAVLDEQPMYLGEQITPERFKAALAQQADEKNMSVFEKLRGSRYVSRTFGMPMFLDIEDIYRTNFKVAGGFAMQDNPKLNIDNYATEDEYWHDLRVSRISNLASANATGLSSLKFGWVATSLAEQSELKANILATVLEAQRGDKPGATAEDKKKAAAAKASLTGALETVRLGLANEDIRGTFTDRVPFVREIEAVLARIHGLEPLEYEKPELKGDLDSAKLDDIFNTMPDFLADADLPSAVAEEDEPSDPETT